MAKEIISTNIVKLAGTIASAFEFSHEMFGEKFYNVLVDVERWSEYVDRIVVCVSERLADVTEDFTGEKIIVKGQFRSHNVHLEDGRTRLTLSVFAKEWEHAEKLRDESDIWLDGYICRKPTYRTTPTGREISDVMIAVNRPYGKSDYIPCITWGRNARFTENLELGTHVKISGRIQSRDYVKMANGIEETRTAFEVSVSMIEIVEE